MQTPALSWYSSRCSQIMTDVGKSDTRLKQLMFLLDFYVSEVDNRCGTNQDVALVKRSCAS
jgi:hypothetical protein